MVFDANAQKNSADTVKIYTLQQCIDTALAKNRQARQGMYNSRSAKIDLKQANTDLIPSLNASINHGLSHGRSIDPATNLPVEDNLTTGSQNLSASLMLFNGLANLYNVREKSTALQAAKLDEQQVKDELSLDVVTAYIQVLTAEDVMKQSKMQLMLTNEQVKRTSLLQQDGAIAPGDFYDLKGQLASDQNTLADAIKSYNDTRINLCNLVNIPYNEGMKLEPLGETPTENPSVQDAFQLYTLASAKLGTLRAADAWKQNASYLIKRAKAAYFPSISVSAYLSSNYSGNEPSSYYDQFKNKLGRGLTFSLQIPILDALSTRNNVSKARINLEQATFEAETRRNELQQKTKQLLLDLKIAKEKYYNLVEQTKAYSESYRIAEVRFNAGDINTVDFLIAKNKMDNAKANLVIARYQWHLQQRLTDYYSGAW
ncbi:outer membrane protein [bacterium A37T11]|nr:outer membrane protein [bacterium A37T11]